MKHTMKINASAFERMQKGIKKREYRVHDEKRQQVNIGDTIIFQKVPDLTERIEMKIENIQHYDSLQAAIEPHFEEDFQPRYQTREETIASFFQNKYCTEEKVKQYGMVVFYMIPK